MCQDVARTFMTSFFRSIRHTQSGQPPVWISLFLLAPQEMALRGLLTNRRADRDLQHLRRGSVQRCGSFVQHPLSARRCGGCSSNWRGGDSDNGRLSISVQWSPPREEQPLDSDLIRSAGHPFKATTLKHSFGAVDAQVST